jgi:NAD(P)-dependent dehydrogenase (short-subunit alcohol dehydrogenase family)
VKRLSGKVAIVTGGSQGIGKAIALAFAKEGAKIVIADLIVTKEILAENISLKKNALVIKTDVSKELDIKNMAKRTLKEFNKIDILVNNAGILFRKSFENTSKREWNKIYSVNLYGAINCIKHVLGSMRNNGGKIINISSVAGHIAAGYPSYASTKAALIALTRDLAREFAPFKINVNAISPGYILTGINKEFFKDTERKNNILKRILWGRLGKPEDIAAAAVFLASEESDYITGTVLVVDGGLSSSIYLG